MKNTKAFGRSAVKVNEHYPFRYSLSYRERIRRRLNDVSDEFTRFRTNLNMWVSKIGSENTALIFLSYVKHMQRLLNLYNYQNGFRGVVFNIRRQIVGYIDYYSNNSPIADFLSAEAMQHGSDVRATSVFFSQRGPSSASIN